MSDALTNRDLRAVLKIYIHVTQLTQEALANLINTNQGNISKILNGQRRRYSIKEFESLRDGLRIPGPLLGLQPVPQATEDPYRGAPDEHAHFTQRRPAVGTSEIPSGTVDRSPAPDQEDDEVKRRAALQIITAVATGTAIPPGTFETVLSSLDEVLDQPVDIDRWQRAIREYGYLTPRKPAGFLIRDLTADLLAVSELAHRENTQSTKNELLRTNAALSTLMAVQLENTENRREARMSWDLARRAADTSNDTSLSVWIRSKEAEGGLYAGMPAIDIEALTKEAVAISKGTPSAGLVRAYAVQAGLAALQGDGNSASKAMNEMTEVFTKLPDSTVADSTYFWGWRESIHHWEEAYIFTAIGDSRAQNATDKSFALIPPGTLGPTANLRLIHSLRMIRTGDIDEGLEETLTTLHEHTQSRTLFRQHMTSQILAALPRQARTLPAARELRALTSI
ncbi:XRE family transcriptional regulator [Actinomadura roseirufa]|uniref:XRE family transcriptional regulator n=1 Tax=Actinomadura roseirufa TaxID=2094049 RepID=UPI00104147C3|nr:XRE family transcriptional regulator [Actinomadura roseirufa]